MAKGADSDNSEVETAYVLSPHSERDYQRVEQDFRAVFEGKQVSFLFIMVALCNRADHNIFIL